MSNYLIKKVVKEKKLQKHGNGLVIILPKNWTDAMDWSRETILVLEFKPFTKQILITEKLKEINIPEHFKKFDEGITDGQTASDPKPGTD
jgi:hypothetical protein